MIDNKLQVPFLFVASNASGNSYLRISPFKIASENLCHHPILKGFTHDAFTDLPLILNRNERPIQIQRKIILDFFDNYLKSSEIDLKEISEKYPEVVFK